MASLLERLKYIIEDIFGKKPMQNLREINIKK